MTDKNKRKIDSKILYDYIKDNKDALKELEILNSIDEDLLRIELANIGINMKYTGVLNKIFPGDGPKSINLCLILYCEMNKNREQKSYYVTADGMSDLCKSCDEIIKIIIKSISKEKLDNYLYFLINKEHTEIVKKIEKHNEKIQYYCSILKKEEEPIIETEEIRKLRNLLNYSNAGYQKIKSKK